MRLVFKRFTVQTNIFVILLILVSFSLVGCEAFARKFTRKHKKPTTKEEPVLVPQEYSISDISIEDRYRQYFLFWKSWQQELITALDAHGSYKKRVSCINEAINNLEQLRGFLFEEKQKELDAYLGRLRQLETNLSEDFYGRKLQVHKRKAEGLKRNIIKDFSYSAVKNHLR